MGEVSTPYKEERRNETTAGVCERENVSEKEDMVEMKESKSAET